MRKLLLSSLLVLAACATPQERCISAIDREIRMIESLADISRGNLARGYALEERTVLVNTEQICGQTAKGKDIICEIPVSEQQTVPVAIDLNAERQKLESLLERLEDLRATRNTRVGQCIAQYPAT